jgi:hypothetical protein
VGLCFEGRVGDDRRLLSLGLSVEAALGRVAAPVLRAGRMVRHRPFDCVRFIPSFSKPAGRRRVGSHQARARSGTTAPNPELPHPERPLR